jgi:dynein heavy chain
VGWLIFIYLFIYFLQLYLKMMEGKKQSLQDASVIDDMYSLLAAYEVKIPTNDQVKLDDLHEVVGKYEDSIEAADFFIERHKNAQMADLDKQVNLISEELMTILGTLHSGKFLIPESDPTEVVADLTKINERIQEIVETVDRYKGYQKLFQVYYIILEFPSNHSSTH